MDNLQILNYQQIQTEHTRNLKPNDPPSMAISTSSGFSPTNSFQILHHSTKSTFPKTFYHFLSHSWSHPKFIIVHSSACPPPVLEEESPPVLPTIEFTYEAKSRPGFETQQPNELQNVNTLIRGLLKNAGTQELGLEYYQKAKAGSEFRSEKTTLQVLLRYLIRSEKWDLICMVCRDMVMFQVLPDSMFCASVVSTCIKARKFKVADILLKSFEFDGKVAGYSYVSALRSYNKLHMYNVAIELYKRVKLSEVVLDPGGYSLIMEAYLKSGNYDKVIEIFSEIDKIESLENGSEVYGILIEALGKSGEGVKALEVFEGMRKKRIPPNASIYAALISSMADLKEVHVVESLVDDAVSKQMLKDPALFLKLVIMYVEEGLMERTLNVVKIMKNAKMKVSDCIFCAIVNGFAKKRGLKAGAKVYQDLIVEGCEPGQVTYASIINVYFRLALFSKAKKVFDEMQQRGFDRCVVAYSTMIVMYGKTGQSREAMRLLAKMKERGCEPNVWVYNALIDLHGRAKDLRQVDKLWREMKRKKLKPDRVSYTSIIGAYSKAREYDACSKFFEEYRMTGGTIDLALAGIMVSVFSKISRVDELVKLLQDLKAQGTKLDTRLYRSALNALRDAGLQLQTKWLQENFETNLSDSEISDSEKFKKRPTLL